MAVTGGTPVISLYGHSNPERTGPYLYRHYVVETYHAELKRETGKTAAAVKFGTRVKGDHIMAQISVEAVTNMLKKVILEENISMTRCEVCEQPIKAEDAATHQHAELPSAA